AGARLHLLLALRLQLVAAAPLLGATLRLGNDAPMVAAQEGTRVKVGAVGGGAKPYGFAPPPTYSSSWSFQCAEAGLPLTPVGTTPRLRSRSARSHTTRQDGITAGRNPSDPSKPPWATVCSSPPNGASAAVNNGSSPGIDASGCAIRSRCISPHVFPSVRSIASSSAARSRSSPIHPSGSRSSRGRTDPWKVSRQEWYAANSSSPILCSRTRRAMAAHQTL